MKRLYLAVALLALAQLALAGEPPRPYIHDDDLSADRIASAVARVRASLDQHGAQSLSQAQQVELERTLYQLEALYADDARPRGSTARSLQRQANTILMPTLATNDSANEVVCRREFRVGSKIPSVRCRTRAELELEQAAASDAVNRWQTGCSLASKEAGLEPSCLGPD